MYICTLFDTMKKYTSEFIGTFSMVFCGTGAMTVNEVTAGSITHVGIAITWGLIVMAMIYAFGETSGAHFNPAVTIAFAFAKQQLGERYVLGGMGPNIWDCSGITKASYAAAGTYIGTHSATNQFYNMAGKRRLVPIKEAVRGDLMWYSYVDDFNGDKYHVVIYLGNGMMLEAPNPLRVVRIVPLRYGDLFRYAGRPTP